MNKSVIQISFTLVFGLCALTTQAATLNTADRLTISPGISSYDAYGNIVNVSVSWFAMDTNGDGQIKGYEKSALLQGTEGIVIGTTQAAGSPSHMGYLQATDWNRIDAPWEFFGNTGEHYTTSPITGDTTKGLNMGGWKATWNGLPVFDLSGGTWTPTNCAAIGVNIPCSGYSNGIARFDWDGVYGHNYALNYAAQLPANDPTGFGGIKYFLHLEGMVQPVPLPASAWLLASGLTGLFGFSRRYNRRV